jgi:thymidylate synthase
MLKPFFLEATTINDAWFGLVYNIYDYGRREVVERGSYEGDTRLEFDWVVCHIKHPGVRPLAIQMPESSTIPPPNDEETIEKYFIEYLMGGVTADDEDYTYGERMVHYTNRVVEPSKGFKFINLEPLDQVQRVIDTYINHGYRNNQQIITIGEPGDILLGDPPCLRHLDTRIQKENDGNYYLHFYPYFRSNDLWNGWPTNLGGIQLLKEYMATLIGVEDGEIMYSSKGLHIYGHMEEVAQMRLCRSDLEE